MVKRYRLNSDFGIVCETTRRGMTIYVVLICVPWEEVIEEYVNIKDKDEANRLFIELRRKYSGIR